MTIVAQGNTVPRSAIVRALEAIEDGDVAFAEQILLSVLDDGPSRLERVCCDECGQGFEWPGLLGEHCRVMHPFEKAQLAA